MGAISLMQQTEVGNTDEIAQVELAVDLLIDAEEADAVAVYEPQNRREANAAVSRLAGSFDGLPRAFARALDAARQTGEMLSDDRFQGLAELVQNADDTGATHVKLLLRASDLLVSHDGSPVRLNHVLGLATPWLSTKGGSADELGRFGIGLMTLRALSPTVEVHCSPYHVRLGDPTLLPIAPPSLPKGFQEDGWTTFRIPVETGSITLQEILEWLDRWDDSALLFLNHVTRLELLSSDGRQLRELALTRLRLGEVTIGDVDDSITVLRQRAQASDGRAWVLYSTAVPSPEGLSRARKATGDLTPISIALPLMPVESGMICAGLPVISSRLPVFINAQFDPLANRRGFLDNEWNRALIPLVGESWAHSVLDLFGRRPRLAWRTIPQTEPADREVGRTFISRLEDAFMDYSRREVANRLSFSVSGSETVSLKELAVEVQPLEGILTEAETAGLADLPAALPAQVRDRNGVWRQVLDEWRCSETGLPDPVSVETALELLADESRPVDSTIALAAAGLDEGLDEQLMNLPCVIAEDGHHLVPPSEDSPDAISLDVTLLARQLGIVTILHSAHRKGSESSDRLLEWFIESGSLIDGTNELEVIKRLAAAGRSGRRLQKPLINEQVIALRNTFEQLETPTRRQLGSDVGSAILLECYIYEGDEIVELDACPHDAYLPRKIDRETESFAVAAEGTPGLKWLSDRYAELLRSSIGRTGVGPQRFLRLLGANVAPILRQHPKQVQRYRNNHRKGLSRGIEFSPTERTDEMRKLDARFTLEDYESPDLQAVVHDISLERRKRTRRRRASALIAAIGRAWDRNLIDFSEVEAAFDRNYWQPRGLTRAFWLWQVGDVPWLDDERGTARRPLELRVRTHGNIAIYGENSMDFLHRDLNRLNRNEVMRAIGVSSDPNRSQLVDRLRRLRDEEDEDELANSGGDVKQEAAIVYKALARDLERRTRSELSPTQLRREFERGQGLILTESGWLPPRSILAGPPIFGNLRAFAPLVADTERLWRALNLREPTPDDCLRVVQSIARKGGEPDNSEKTILLETMRKLAEDYTEASTTKPNKRRFTRLALWTSNGWMRKRPIFTTNDPVLAKGLRDLIPLWEPGGDLEQFRSLIGPLGVTEIQTDDAAIIETALAIEDGDATKLLRSAMSLLREDLARNEPALAGSGKVPWDTLERLSVHVHPSLSLRIPALTGHLGREYTSEVDAKMDIAQEKMFIRNPLALPRVDIGGSALAEVFRGNKRSLALAWRAACDKADEDIEAMKLELAHQRQERRKAEFEEEMERRTALLQEQTGKGKVTAGGTSSRRSSSRAGKPDKKKAAELGPPRTLVDPNSLQLVDRRGRIEEPDKKDRPPRASEKGLVQPEAVSSIRRNRTPLAGYSQEDKEDVGMELAKLILSSDENEIVDIRNQRGVGADAIDSLKNYYELKVSAGAEPDQVTLTSSEVKRALNTPEFFLVIVSGVEGTDARPKVRVFVDPLNQLSQEYSGKITLSGIRSTTSLVYEFEPGEDSG